MNEEEMAKFLATSQMKQEADAANASMQQQAMYQEMEKGLAEEQLDVDGIIYSLFNLLQGNKISFDKDGRRSWETNSDPSLKVLSENGVQRTMQVIISYVNKLKMLSNHNNEEILKAMFNFTTELNDNFLMRYEDIFYTPSYEECQTILKNRMREQRQLKEFARELLGKKENDKLIDREVKQEMEGRIEYELKKIREEERKKRVKEYGMLILLIEHQVLDTYRRSEGGKERDTLRRHASFSEIRAIGEPKKEGGMFGWLK